MKLYTNPLALNSIQNLHCSRKHQLLYKRRFHKPFIPILETWFAQESEPLQEIEEVVDLLKDGQWHQLEDVANKTKLPNSKTNKILEFLADYDFIDLDIKHKKAKSNPALTKFLKEAETR